MLGGSFNPAHQGHAHIAQALRARLRLHQVWLLVSPGNPLKPARGMAPFAQRLASARAIATPPAIIATNLESALGTRFSVDTARRLRQRFPRAHFVWLMGADVWAELPRWRRWRRFAATLPIAIHARPGANRAARAGAASQTLRAARLPARAATRLPTAAPPAWAFLDLPPSAISATALRAAGLGLQPVSPPRA